MGKVISIGLLLIFLTTSTALCFSTERKNLRPPLLFNRKKSLEESIVYNDLWARPSSGIFAPISSLKTRWGVGNIGSSAMRFIDWLSANGQSMWAVLPIQETCALLEGDPSPYNPLSAFSKESALIPPDEVIDVINSPEAQALIDKYEKSGVFDSLLSKERLDYKEIARYILPVLQLGFKTFKKDVLDKGSERDIAFKAFLEKKKDWINNYAVYRALAGHYRETDWRKWDNRSLMMRDGAALREAEERFKDEILFYKYLQFIFDEHWQALRDYAHNKGVSIRLDIPFYVGIASADAWELRDHVFDLDPDNNFAILHDSGAEPDPFEPVNGQNWGSAVYRVKDKRENVDKFWIRRCDELADYADGFRLDHFRAFHDYWEIPHGKPGRFGAYQDGPGAELLAKILNRTLYSRLVQPFAEDLGTLSRGIPELLKRAGLFGYKVILFGWGTDNDRKYKYPEEFPFGITVWTSTHDTDTFTGWWSNLTSNQRREFINYAAGDGQMLGEENNPEISWESLEAIFKKIYYSRSAQIFTPIQDVFKLGKGHRINIPNQSEGVWGWRMPWTPEELIKGGTPEIDHGNAMLIRLTKESGRHSMGSYVKKDTGVYILGTLPDVTVGAEEMCEIEEDFSVWAAIKGEPKEVNIWTNLPENEGEFIEKRRVSMKFVRKLPNGTMLYHAMIKAIEPGQWWFTIQADGKWAGQDKQNGYLTVKPKDREKVPVWTFGIKDQLFKIGKGPVIIRTESPGTVYAGVKNKDGSWDRTYNAPLFVSSRGVYEAILPDGIDIFTFSWRDGKWEGRDFHIERVINGTDTLGLHPIESRIMQQGL